jgi:hypothetical protein
MAEDEQKPAAAQSCCGAPVVAFITTVQQIAEQSNHLQMATGSTAEASLATAFGVWQTMEQGLNQRRSTLAISVIVREAMGNMLKLAKALEATKI